MARPVLPNIPGAPDQVPQLPRQQVRHALLRLGPPQVPGHGHRRHRAVRHGRLRPVGVQHGPDDVPADGGEGAHRRSGHEQSRHPGAVAVLHAVRSKERGEEEGYLEGV